jgi:hypothetical protein
MAGGAGPLVFTLSGFGFGDEQEPTDNPGDAALNNTLVLRLIMPESSNRFSFNICDRVSFFNDTGSHIL